MEGHGVNMMFGCGWMGLAFLGASLPDRLCVRGFGELVFWEPCNGRSGGTPRLRFVRPSAEQRLEISIQRANLLRIRYKEEKESSKNSLNLTGLNNKTIININRINAHIAIR